MNNVVQCTPLVGGEPHQRVRGVDAGRQHLQSARQARALHTAGRCVCVVCDTEV